MGKIKIIMNEKDFNELYGVVLSKIMNYKQSLENTEEEEAKQEQLNYLFRLNKLLGVLETSKNFSEENNVDCRI